MGIQTSRMVKQPLSQPPPQNPSNTTPAFLKVPPEILSKIMPLLGRRDLAAMALTSRIAYPHANCILYEMIEVSFCKCSQSYIDNLCHTITNSLDLTALVRSLVIDMRVPCYVWSYETFATTKSRDILKKSPPPPAHAHEFVEEAIKMTQNLMKIMPLLTNLDSISLVLGSFDKDPQLLYSLLQSLSPLTLGKLRSLELRDLGLVRHPSVSALCSLRSIDLGYTTLRNSDLGQIISANHGTLEELSLEWIIESSQVPFFTDFTDMPLVKLKSFVWRGYQTCQPTGLLALLSDSLNLQELRAEDLSTPTALVWGRVLLCMHVKSLQRIAFSAPTGCTDFWSHVASFLSQVGQTLEELSLSGSGRHSFAPLPPVLRECLARDMQSQPSLKRLLLIWRDGVGMDYDSIRTIGMKFPTVEFLHLYLTFPSPAEDSVAILLDVLRPYRSLSYMHLVFPIPPGDPRTTDNPAGAATIACLKSALANENDPVRQLFLRKAAENYPMLRQLSWCLHQRRSPPHPSIFVQVREKQPVLVLDDITTEPIAHLKRSPHPHLCTIGTKKAWLSQRPGWKEDMGNILLENGGLCSYADFEWKLKGLGQSR